MRFRRRGDRLPEGGGNLFWKRLWCRRVIGGHGGHVSLRRVLEDICARNRPAWMAGCTFEHILPLPVKYTSPRLQVLTLQELGHRECFRISRRPTLHRHLLRVLVVVVVSLGLLLLLLGLLLLLVLLQSLGFELIDVLFGGEAMLCCVFCELLALHVAEFLGRHATFCCFGGELLLHCSDLLRIWLRWSSHDDEW